MPTWNEAEYIRRAGDIAREFVGQKKPLNDLCEKVARDEALNPDEIRTLVRLSNVAAFQELFKGKAQNGATDRNVEFDVGNPESVIQRIQSSVEDPPQTANIHNDKLAFEIPDQMREIRQGKKFDARVKVAHQDVPERPVRRDMAILAARKLASEFEVAKFDAGHRWDAATYKLAMAFKRAPGYGPAFDAFEKDAFAEYGEDIFPEMYTLYQCFHKDWLTRPGNEKIAQLQDRHVTEDTAELALLKQAVAARHEYEKFKNGLDWLKKNTP